MQFSKKFSKSPKAERLTLNYPNNLSTVICIEQFDVIYIPGRAMLAITLPNPYLLNFTMVLRRRAYGCLRHGRIELCAVVLMTSVFIALLSLVYPVPLNRKVNDRITRSVGCFNAFENNVNCNYLTINLRQDSDFVAIFVLHAPIPNY